MAVTVEVCHGQPLRPIAGSVSARRLEMAGVVPQEDAHRARDQVGRDEVEDAVPVEVPCGCNYREPVCRIAPGRLKRSISIAA